MMKRSTTICSKIGIIMAIMVTLQEYHMKTTRSMVVEAWMVTTQSSMMMKKQQMPLLSSLSNTVLLSKVNQEGDEIQNDGLSSIEEIPTSTTTNRRHFFGRVATVTAASMIVATGALTSTSFPLLSSVANAATTTTANDIDYKYYTPTPGSLKGQVIVITGGTAGLGLESAKRLSLAGATVVITSRNEEKGKKAVQNVQTYVTSKGQELSPIYSIPLDLDDFRSVREFPTLFKGLMKDNVKIDVLMNNAGVMAIPERELTINGYERTFQSNHLGHFLLTNLCIPFLLKASNGPARVINVSSSAHTIPGNNGLDMSNLNGEMKYGPWISYGQSKLSNVLFTNELNQRLKAASLPIISISLHPGAVQTDLGRNLIGIDKWDKMKASGGMSTLSWNEQLLFNVLSKFVLTVEEGASTQIYVSSYPTVNAGQYYDLCKVSPLESYALDSNKAKQLWELSEEMTGQKFSI